MSLPSAFLVQKAIGTVLIIYVAFLFSSLVYLLIGFFLSRGNWQPVITESFLADVLFALWIVISAVLIFLILRIKSKAFGEEMPSPQNLDQLQRYVVSRFVLLFALSEVPAILGLVYFLLTGRFLYLVLFCVLSFLCFAVARPSRSKLMELPQRYGNLG